MLAKQNGGATCRTDRSMVTATDRAAARKSLTDVNLPDRSLLLALLIRGHRAVRAELYGGIHLHSDVA